MKENHDIEIEKAEQHAEGYSDMLKTLAKKIYKDAFIHGYKHGWFDYEAGHN